MSQTTSSQLQQQNFQKSTNQSINPNLDLIDYMWLGGNQQQQLTSNLPNLLNLQFRSNARMNCSPINQQSKIIQQPVQLSSNQYSIKQSNHNMNNMIGNTGRTKPHCVSIKYKFGRLGQDAGQLSSPHGFCFGTDEEIVIADTFNHRICIFDKTGQFINQFGQQGKTDGLLWYPRKVALIKSKTRPNGNCISPSSRFVVCDRGSERSRMQIFSKDGHFQSRIEIKYIDIVAGLAVTDEGHIVAVDSVSATLFVINENGECFKCFECGVHMQEPSDIAVHNDLFYICDFKGHSVVVFNESGQCVAKIGDKKLTNYPNGIDISPLNGDILIGDSHGNKFHIVVFTKDGQFKQEYECNSTKVSRCCGLKITREGYIVTLAKNNHHVLVLDSLNSINQQSQSPQINNQGASIINSPMINTSNILNNKQQILPILNSPSHLSTTNSTNNKNLKDDLDLNDYMTQVNLHLLALCDTSTTNITGNINQQSQQQQQNSAMQSPNAIINQQKMATFNQLNDLNNNNNDLSPNHNILSSNLHLLALCDSSNVTENVNQQQTNQSAIQSPNSLANQQKISAFNQFNILNNNNNNNNNDLTPNYNLISSTANQMSPFNQSHHQMKMHNSSNQSSTLNTSFLEQQLQELSFNESNSSLMMNNLSILSTKSNNNNSCFNDSTGGQRVDLNSLSILNTSSLASPTPPDSNVTTPNSKTGKISMIIRSKFGHLGSNKGQFSSPHGFCLGADEEIVIADTYNHRICIFNKEGEFLYQFGTQGKEQGELFHPRKVAVTKVPANSGGLGGLQQKQPKFVVCDRGNEKSRMQLFNRNGGFIRKISIRYIDIVAGLAITPMNNIVAVDSVMPTVFIISEAGELIKWFDCSKHMREPSDIAINGDLYYICDFKGHCVVVFNESGEFLHTIGNETITKFPNGIDISDMGDILVGDSHGNRFHVVVFDGKDGKTLCEYECPYVKVSRCCGLKLTSEGYVVTLAKNNHHVLILNTLFIM